MASSIEIDSAGIRQNPSSLRRSSSLLTTSRNSVIAALPAGGARRWALACDRKVQFGSHTATRIPDFLAITN